MEMGAEHVWFPVSSVVQPGTTVEPPKAHSGVRALCTLVNTEPKPIVLKTMVMTSVNAVRAPKPLVEVKGVNRHDSSLVRAVTSPLADVEQKLSDVPKHCPRFRIPGKVTLMQLPPFGREAKAAGTRSAKTKSTGDIAYAIWGSSRT